MVGRKALSLVSVAAVALAVASSAVAQTPAAAPAAAPNSAAAPMPLPAAAPALGAAPVAGEPSPAPALAAAAAPAPAAAPAATRAPDSKLAGLVFPTRSRDWSSDPGGFKGATLDLAASLVGKACGPDEFHVWPIADFAAGVTLSEAVDDAFRAGGWTLDLVSRDNELSRIYIASRGEEALVLNWMPEEGVVGLLMCVAAEPGSVPERVAEVADQGGVERGYFSLDPNLPPLPIPRPDGAGRVVAVAEAVPGLGGSAIDAPSIVEGTGATSPDVAAGGPVMVAAAGSAATPPGPGLSGGPLLPTAAPGPGAAGLGPTVPVAAPTETATAPVVEGGAPASPPGVESASATAGMLAEAASGPSTIDAPMSPVPMGAPDASSTSPAASFAASSSPTRTPIDLSMTAAIAEPAPSSETVVAAAEPMPPAPTGSPEPLAAMYERLPPPPGLINPRSVAEAPVAPVARPQPVTPAPAPGSPLLAQSEAPAALTAAKPAASEPAFRSEPVPVSTVLAPVVEPRGAMWPLFLIAVLLAGAALVILLRRQPWPSAANALWPTTLASVVGAELDERVGSEGIQFTPVLRYRFAVGENEFEAVSEGWGGRALASRSAAEAVLANFPDHARVEISYDPTDPTRIVLPEATRPPDPLVMVAAACLALAALTLVLTLF